MKNFYFFYFTVNMVMSLSLIDDGDDIFNHILYSGGLTILRAIIIKGECNFRVEWN